MLKWVILSLGLVGIFFLALRPSNPPPLPVAPPPQEMEISPTQIAMPAPIHSEVPGPSLHSLPAASPGVKTVSAYVMPGFQDLSIDARKEKLILTAGMSEIAKRLILSGVLLDDNEKNGKPREVATAGFHYQSELNAHQADFFSGVKVLRHENSELPPDLRENLVTIAAQLNPEPNADVQTLATAQIESAVSTGNLNSHEDLKRMMDAITAVVQTSEDPASAWKKVEGMINREDPVQGEAYRAAHQMVEIRARAVR